MIEILSILVIIQIFATTDKYCVADPLHGAVEYAAKDEFPFVVSIARYLHIMHEDRYGHICGGALITHKHVLTTAHCFEGNGTARDYLVYSESNDLEFSRTHAIESIVTYDEWARKRRCGVYGYKFWNNDIAIVELVASVSENIRLPKLAKYSAKRYYYHKAVTAGWGLHSSNGVPRYLLKTNLRVITIQECMTNIYKNMDYRQYFRVENILCTNGDEGFAVFSDGDSGSPLLVKNENGEYEIIGINESSAPKSEHSHHIPHEQNIHVVVYYYLAFIKNVLGH